MKKSVALGLASLVAAGAAAAIAGKIVYDKVSKEIKGDLRKQIFISPNGLNTVTLSYGSSETAKGLTYIKVSATKEGKDDECKLAVFAKKDTEFINGEWPDEEHFELRIGNGKRKQCCDISFEEKEITANYYLTKVKL